MSKNFEMMQQSGLINETFAKPQTNAPFRGFESERRFRAAQREEPDQLVREECKKLIDRIFLTKRTKSLREVVFAGIDHGSGCSRICAHAAVVLANNAAGSVCLVEANLRSPSLASFFGLSNELGLTDALLQTEPIRSFTKPLGPENLWLLSSGLLPATSSGFTSCDQLQSRLEELRREFEYVLIDAPPLNQYADAIALGRIADGLVLILEANSTRRESAVKELDGLRQAKIQVLGAVLNKRTYPIPQSVYDRL